MKNAFKEIASNIHADTNHFYDKTKHYSVHLQMVVDYAEKFIHLIPERDRSDVYAACWLHDVIEDCRMTYNDVKAISNTLVAELVYALTNEKGRTRKDRGNGRYYFGINNCPYAPFVKMCDRMANMKYSKDTGSKMYEMYQKELNGFCDRLKLERLEEMKVELYSI